MRTWSIAALSLVLVSAVASAQTLNFDLDAVAAKAKEKAEVTLEGALLAQALQMAPDKVKTAGANVSRIVLRHYEFDQTGQYSDSDLDGIRKQVSNWPRLVNVKDEKESVEIYMLTQNGKPGGFLLMVAEPKELTVIHVVGSIDLASLKEVVNSTIHYDLNSAGQ